jgi:nucleotide-binding universal stress UspA family protein
MSPRDHTKSLVVVVGYDGGETGRTALQWALGRVGRSGRVVIVNATRDRMGTTLPPPLGLGRHDREALGMAVLDELVLEDDELIGARFDTEVVDDHPAAAILRVAADRQADEIVVGRRTHGLRTALLGGSVSSELIEKADRPVVVVR